MIPLSSDTETKPTEAMRAAMAAAEVGDEQRGEDPTVNRLQERVADLLGKEDALWLPTGTLCNVLSVRVHTRPADAVIAEAMCHVIRAEAAGAAVCSGVQLEPMPSARGIFDPSDVDAAVDRLASAPPRYGPPPALVCFEQTHNFGGGTVWPVASVEAAAEAARRHGLATHMDGARLMNAVVASGTPAAAFAAPMDSVWIDFTKGLGAPVGAVLAGSRGFVEEARRQKHVFGGAMRQAGIVAAGCLHALDQHVDRLAEDHANARRLAAGLLALEGLQVTTPEPETNIVLFQVDRPGLTRASFLAGLAEHGVRMGAVGPGIRAVTHLDVGAADIDAALSAVAAVLRAT